MRISRTGGRGFQARDALGGAALILGLLFASFAQAATYTARVVAITDGDTLRTLHEGRAVVVRLRWIDAPENGQAFGDQAKQALGELVAGRIVVGSEADARALAASLPLAPYAEVTVRRTDILRVPPAARDRTSVSP